MTKLNLNNISTISNATVALNQNFQLIEEAIENTLSRDGTNPNQMDVDLDLNNNGLLNVTTLNGVTIADIKSSQDAADDAEASAIAASTSATDAATSASDAATFASDAASSLGEFTDLYLGDKASDPSTDNDGDVLQAGALYFNTSTNKLRVYNGSSWEDAVPGTDSYLLISNNLNDLDNVTTARSNLGLGTAATNDTGDFAAASHTHTLSQITDAGTAATLDYGTASGEVARLGPGGRFNTGRLIDGSLSAGDVLYYNGSSIVNLGIGTAGQALVVNAGATAPEWANVGGNYELLETVVLNNTATADFTAFDSSKWGHYVFMLASVLPVNVVELHIRTSQDGVNWDSGAGAYRWVTTIANTVNTAPVVSGSASATSITATGTMSNGGGEGVSGQLILNGPDRFDRNQINGVLSYESNDGGGTLNTSTVAGARLTGPGVEGVRFYAATGNLASGVIQMYGLRRN